MTLRKYIRVKWIRICRIPSTRKGGWQIRDAKIVNGVVKAEYVKVK